MSEREPIAVVGVGWVGLVTSACFAELGNPVIAVDIDEAKIAALRSGEVRIHEPQLAELVAKNAERLTFTTDIGDALASARLLFCCVDTPPTYSGDADLSRVRAVVETLGGNTEGHALVMKSTVPAGSGRTIQRDLPGLAYVSCPEFLKEGSAIEDFMHPDRVVIGANGDDWAADAVAELYAPLGGELVRTDVASAEMIKLASNAFLATKISFINEIANVCEEVGADVTEVAAGMGLDERIGPSFLRAGIGFGGSCFVGSETLLARLEGTPRLMTFEELWTTVAAGDAEEAFAPADLRAWSWVPGEAEPEWMPVSVLTKRHYVGDVIRVDAGAGRQVTVTADHPFVVGDGRDDSILTHVLASELTPDDWLPLDTTRLPEPSLVAPTPRSQLLTVDGTGSDRGGYRRFAAGEMPWVRVISTDIAPFDGDVYSLKIPGSHTVVTSGGLVVGQCFPKDVSALKQLAGNTGYHFQLLNSVIEVNELQKRRVIGKLEKHLGSLVGKRIALLGLAFKPDTDDMREASSLVLSARLQGEGASVIAYDPVAEETAAALLPAVEMAPSATEALAGADAAVLVTEWGEFRDIDWAAAAAAMRSPVIVDGRNFLDPGPIRAAGFSYEGIGRPSAGDLE